MYSIDVFLIVGPVLVIPEIYVLKLPYEQKHRGARAERAQHPLIPE